MYKFITFTNTNQLPTSINLARFVGFEIRRNEACIIADFMIENNNNKYSHSKPYQAQNTLEIIKALNKRILDFIKNKEQVILDFDEAFAEVVNEFKKK